MSFLLGRYTGLVLPPTAWAINTQLGQILPYADCNGGVSWTLIGAFAAAAIAAAGVLFCYNALTAQPSQTGSFVGKLSLLFGLAVSFALILQVAATILVNPCAR